MSRAPEQPVAFDACPQRACVVVQLAEEPSDGFPGPGVFALTQVVPCSSCAERQRAAAIERGEARDVDEEWDDRREM
jgi:hypothetical protein